MSQQAAFVPITLDRPRHLRLNFNALCAFEREIGSSVITVFGEGGKNVGFNVIRALLWAGLRHEDKSLTIDKAGDLFESLPGEDFQAKAEAFMSSAHEALAWILGGTEEAKKKLTAEPPTSSAESGTGMSSNA